MNRKIINNLPIQFSGQAAYLIRRGDEDMANLLDSAPLGVPLTTKQLSAYTGIHRQKVRALLTYLIHEGRTTELPQVIKQHNRFFF